MKKLATIAAALLLAAASGPADGREWELTTDIGDGRVLVGGGSAGGFSLAWAVTSTPATGVDVFYYNGSAWAVQTSLFTTEGEIRGLFVAPPGNRAWLVGNSRQPSSVGHIYCFNGSAWAHQTTTIGTLYLYSAYASDSSNVWVGGGESERHHLPLQKRRGNLAG